MGRTLQDSTAMMPAESFDGLRLSMTYELVADMKAPSRLVRDHTQRQIKKLAQSLKDFGAIMPVVLDAEGVIVAGVAIIEAARKIGMVHFPTVRVAHLDSHQLRLFRIAHTKLSEGGSWNQEALRIEFAEISIERPELELGTSGFEVPERDIIFGRHNCEQHNDLDEDPDPEAGPSIARLGDVFLLGKHRLVCGDSTNPAVIADAVAGQRVRTVASDLPYNVKIENNVSGFGKVKHRDFAMAAGEMNRTQFVAFLERSITALQPHLVDGALLYLFQDWRHLMELCSAAEACNLSQLNLLVWAKANAAMGSFYRSAHEMIGVFKHGTAAHTNNVELGRHGRSRSNVIQMPGVNSFGKGRSKALEMHPTVKPVAMIADFILDSSEPDERILDPFGGSGTTIIAAEKTDRVASLVELDPKYVDVTCRRFAALTGEAAIHVDSGLRFESLGDIRTGEAN